ncbi:ABC transporter ATP-binding protein [Diplocloster agilis]|uniref:ABC transporter ATP-binding protein n=1 Tax=Diplocloster agilis TaxID=2850323 RepID=UPI0008216F13|nr:ABC transporter ATP-binding protein [Suonthocola fibrivorans]MCU6733232.1 ABC transporter ATP-binding protein/permease [Suonthocola fibrivorans]SCI82096.1 Putative multidrug export ATP-binding/permease protein SAV1866 [uncultured Clostridium sp.]
MKQTVKKLYNLLDFRQKLNFIFILIIMIFSAGLAQITPKAIGWLTDDIFSQEQISFDKIVPILLLILVVNIINQLIIILRRIMVEDTATQTEKKARGIVISSLLKASLKYFKNNMTGNIHGRLNRCLEGTVKLEKLIFMDFAPAIFNSIGAIIVIFITLPAYLALPTLLVIPIGIAIVFRQISTQKGIRIELLETKASMDGSIVELLNGIEVIRMSDSNTIEEKRFDEKSEFLRNKEMKHHYQMAKYDSFKFFNEIFFTVLMIGASSYLATRQIISVGSILTSYLCFSQLIKPLEELHRILDELSESLILAEDFFKMTEIPNDFSYSIPEKNGINESIFPLHMIDIVHLNFSYDEETVLTDINLSIDKGCFLGIAGPSGGGKSSLIKTICKLEKAKGKIYIDGKDIDGLSRKEIADIIALVPQNPFLIAGTLYENICYGLEDEPTLAEINEAIKKANLYDFINSLPDKLYTMIAEHGNNLSGGQKQRIAIARIFLRKPKILVLDEATSALDNTSEKQIQNEIEKLKEENQMTIISIAHRLTTLKNCDNIIVVNHGKIVQSGRYDELVETDGIFSDMYYGRLK